MGSRAYSWWRAKRLLFRPQTWLVFALVLLVTWWSQGGKTSEIQVREVQSRLSELFPPEFTRDLQFFPASNKKINYVGRWTAAPNRLRFDGTFPGVYLELNITNTSTIVLSLQNAKPDPAKPIPLHNDDDVHMVEDDIAEPHSQYAFTMASRTSASAPPISLLALVDEEEYVVLPNATSLVPVHMRDLNPRLHHTVRVIAPMTDNEGQGIVQIDGLWLDKGGQLNAVEGSSAEIHQDNEEDEDFEVGRSHRLGLANLLRHYSSDQIQQDEEDIIEPLVQDARRRRKLIEIVTDTPSHMNNLRVTSRTGGADGLLSGVMGWEYLIGEMFSVDHVCVGAEGMCLTHDCVGGTGAPNGMGDVFFRSGPSGSHHFAHPWSFQSYVPDVMVLNLGASDHYSFQTHLDEYNKTESELYRNFEDTYISLVKAIRNLAYPTHPAQLELQRLGLEAYADDTAPANIPIFIMRPFNGELEHSTQNAVTRLRNEGDKAVFWLDTTGWLDPEDTGQTASDFFWDPNEPDAHPHLTERGNQKVAIYLHMHVCRYLAQEEENCAFLPPEVYTGNVYDPTVAQLDRFIEKEKEDHMRAMFFEAPQDHGLL